MTDIETDNNLKECDIYLRCNTHMMIVSSYGTATAEQGGGTTAIELLSTQPCCETDLPITYGWDLAPRRCGLPARTGCAELHSLVGLGHVVRVDKVGRGCVRLPGISGHSTPSKGGPNG